MALHWNLNKIESDDAKFEERDGETFMHPITHALIFHTINVNMGEITEKNWKEFYSRVYAWEHTFGPLLRNEKLEEVYITPDDVKDRIGLVTNVTTKTANRMKNLIWDDLMQRAKVEIANATVVMEESNG